MDKYKSLSAICEEEDLFEWGLKCDKQISPLLNTNTLAHAKLCCVLHKAKADEDVDLDEFAQGFQYCLKSLSLGAVKFESHAGRLPGRLRWGFDS